MRSRIFTAVLCAAALTGAPVLARPLSPGGGDGVKSMAGDETGARVVTGTVKKLEAGKWLDVRTKDNRDETFQLDDKDLTVKMDPGVKVGSKVRVSERVDSGHRTLTVEKIS